MSKASDGSGSSGLLHEVKIHLARLEAEPRQHATHLRYRVVTRGGA